MQLVTRHSSATPTPVAAQNQALRQKAEAVFAPPTRPSGQPLPISPASLPDSAAYSDNLRDRVFAVIGHNRVGNVNTQHLRRLMREVVTWIPDFKEFAALCTEGLHTAWRYDRETKVRTARTTRAQWLRLFRYFAQHRQMDADIRIRASNKIGHYVCELIPRCQEEDTDWREFLRLGRQLGATAAELKRLKVQVMARATSTATPLHAPTKGRPKSQLTKQVSHMTLALTN